MSTMNMRSVEHQPFPLEMFLSSNLQSSIRTDTMCGATLADITGSSKLLVPGRVTSKGSIPQGVTSLPIDPNMLKGKLDVIQLSVEVGQHDVLELDKRCKEALSDNIHWVRSIRLSEDCHNYNIQLKRYVPHKQENLEDMDVKPKLILQVVKPIEVGQELLLWLSEELLAIIQMAFLIPINIQGQKKYVCNICSRMFESPNPLKLHLTLGCNRYPVSYLWEKLANAMSEEPNIQNSFKFKLSPRDTQAKQKFAMDLSKPQIMDLKLPSPRLEQENNAANNNHTNNMDRSYMDSHRSAFRPFLKSEMNTVNNCYNSFPHVPTSLPMIQYISPAALPQDLLMYPSPSPGNGPNFDSEAHIETLVSSLGKSKRGHICLYCGKCYSRKYGLKIHIRTHTGYKPLKCKFCLRPFGDPSNLNKHVRLHAEGDTPYKCDLCSKVLVRRRDLERHLKSRHMEEIHPNTNIEEENSNESSITEEDQILTIDD